eukprot:gnl/Dysnectes_brevis/1667_a1897_1196.p1 GENE.gnl/Dysnectes_brevis/1667_a1897_1196~~gnl/Dysnectes_brevis/1667_a1897_1196.p1  ORF type:complete len:831 (+),score=338.14 gnl/Dysnectes_brevis/1667_a1897_1196:46-2538(+)
MQSSITAIILADNFNDFLRPLSDDFPVILFPVGNIPIIDFMIHHLYVHNITQIAIVSSSHHSETIFNYVKEESRWKDMASLQFDFISTIGSNPVLALIRAVEFIDLKRDFLLIDGPSVFNTDIHAFLSHHKQAATGDTSYCLTQAFSQGSPDSTVRPLGAASAVVTDSNGHLKSLDGDWDIPHISIDLDCFKKGKRLHISRAMLESPLYMVRNSFLAFAKKQENVDITSIRGLVRAVLDDELNRTQFNIGVHVLPSTEMAAKVDSMRAYRGISRAFIKRYLTPFIPTANILFPHGRRTHVQTALNKSSIMIDGAVSASPKSSIIGVTLIGRHTTLAAGSRLQGSVVGRDCYLGAGVDVQDCILMDHVRIDGPSKLRGCVIGHHAKLYGVDLPPGSVVGKGTQLYASDVRARREQQDEDALRDGAASCGCFSSEERPVFVRDDSHDGDHSSETATTTLPTDDDSDAMYRSTVSFMDWPFSKDMEPRVAAQLHLEHGFQVGCPVGIGLRRHTIQDPTATTVGAELFHKLQTMVCAPIPMAEGVLSCHVLPTGLKVPLGPEPFVVGLCAASGDEEEEEDLSVTFQAVFVELLRATLADQRYLARATDADPSETLGELNNSELEVQRATRMQVNSIVKSYNVDNMVVIGQLLKSLLAICMLGEGFLGLEQRDGQAQITRRPGSLPGSSASLGAVRYALWFWGYGDASLFKMFEEDDEGETVRAHEDELLCSLQDAVPALLAIDFGAASLASCEAGELEEEKKLCAKLLHTLYNCDLVSEDAIVSWYSGLEGSEDVDEQLTRHLFAPFVRWLSEADEEGESGDSYEYSYESEDEE